MFVVARTKLVSDTTHTLYPYDNTNSVPYLGHVSYFSARRTFLFFSGTVTLDKAWGIDAQSL